MSRQAASVSISETCWLTMADHESLKDADQQVARSRAEIGH
jgi:hypothetical protein